MNVTILGAGSMGTALASALMNKHKITLWTIEQDVYEQVSNHHENKKYLSGVIINASITMSMREALKNAEAVIISVPSSVVRKVIRSAREFLPDNAIIIDVAKGLEKGSNKRMSEVIKEEVSNHEIISVGGPSIAKELGNKVPTFVVYACNNISVAKRISEEFSNDYYHISVSDDVTGVELCGTFKNIIAILAGFSDGLGYGVNTKAGLIAKGLGELRLIASKLGANESTINGLAGVGDVVVTCMSQHSRNRRFGELIAKGHSIDEALSIVGQVVEGVNACRIAYGIISDYGLDCPLILRVYNVLFNGKDCYL